MFTWLSFGSAQPSKVAQFSVGANSPRHKGTCYKAANWTLVGRTVGRGKKSTSHLQVLPTKDIWLYPLRRDYSTTLRA